MKEDTKCTVYFPSHFQFIFFNIWDATNLATIPLIEVLEALNNFMKTFYPLMMGCSYTE